MQTYINHREKGPRLNSINLHVNKSVLVRIFVRMGYVISQCGIGHMFPHIYAYKQASRHKVLNNSFFSILMVTKQYGKELALHDRSQAVEESDEYNQRLLVFVHIEIGFYDRNQQWFSPRAHGTDHVVLVRKHDIVLYMDDHRIEFHRTFSYTEFLDAYGRKKFNI